MTQPTPTDDADPNSAGLGAAGAAIGGVTGLGLSAAGAANHAGGDVLGGVADAIKIGLAPLMAVQKLSDLAAKAWLPTTIIRIVSGIGGAFFIILGIVLLAREVVTNAPKT